MSTPAAMLAPEPIDLAYEADLLGNIQQALAGLQGFDVMALELIQNADDARAEALAFDVRDDALVVQNDGRFSTCGLGALRCPWERGGGPDGLLRSCNFHAISRVGSRSKVHASGQIGRFGIGFVSVYQITDSPIIRSAGIEMRLDPLRGAAPTVAVADAGGTEFELPWAWTPSPTRQALNASPTPNDVAPLLLDAIADVMTRGLFFLRHLRRVELRRNGVLKRSVAIRREGGLVTLEIAPEARIERWKVLTRDAADLAAERDIFTNYPTLAQLERSPVVHVAIPITDDPISGLLYAYLPTEQRSGMPLHVNGDFFPHPNRRSIVLSGEQHERYWNELLLDTAARAIGEAFEELRDLLGGSRLWTLGNAAFALRDTKGFSEFWKVFGEAARVLPSIWTIGREWRKPTECHLPPEEMADVEQVALTNIGLKLLHPDLRPLWTVLSSVGATPLRLPTVVDALKARGESPHVSLDDPHLHPLWSAVDVMIEVSRSGKGFRDVLERLKATTFLLDADGEPASINDVWHPPTSVSAGEIRNYIADCPLVHPEVYRHAAILDAIDVYGFDDFAGHLAEAITDVSSAMSVIGIDGPSASRFYELLTAFDVDPHTSRASAILADVPMLRTLEGFVSPSRGQLPGGFVDPIGHFELVDRALLGEQMCEVARTILGVQVLTFNDYVEDHLEEILEAGPTREQYTALLLEIVNHQAELGADGGLDALAEQAFVRTRSGCYARPDDCYYWSAALEVLLGDEGGHWVDEGWMPSGRAGSRFRDLLESKLGMRSTVSTRHIVDRIAHIAESATIDDIASRTTPIVRHILDRLPRMGPTDRVELERLRSIAFLPGAVNDERVQGKRFTPAQVYRAFRSNGFSSQVIVVDLSPLRGGPSGSSLIEFLDLLKMPTEPPTEKVVAHLENCMAAGLPAPDTAYAILNERLDASDAGCIDRLAGSDFIYDGELKRYLPADKVFWERPPFGGHWHAAASRMRQREALFRRLGVVDVPTAANYAALLREIASQAHPSVEDAEVHARCLAWLADALDQGVAEAEEAIDGLHNEYALLNLKRVPVWTEDAAWVDSPGLAAPFGDVLDERLVAPPPVSHRTAVARLFRQMGVVPLSEIARLRLASVPDHSPAPAATELLRERADLLLWLAPTQEFRKALRDALSRIEIRFTDSLQVHAEIVEFDPPVHSPANSVAAFYDSQADILHIRAEDGRSVNWSAAFRALFAQLERYSQSIDMRPVVMTAAFVTSRPTWTEAEQELTNSDYRPPEEARDDLPLGTELGDAPDDPIDKDALDGRTSEDIEQGKQVPAGNSAEEDDKDKSGEKDPTGDDPVDEPKTEYGDEAGPDGEAEGEEVSDGQTLDGLGLSAPVKDNSFKSKADTGALAGDPQGSSVRAARRASGVTNGSARGTDGPGTSGGSRHQESSAERQTRRSRMLAYVGTGGDRSDAARRVGDDDDISDLIDVAAIAAVLKYERARGWLPEEQPHANPGYDIISRSADGASRRLIEVKGLEGEWTERGVKLSHVQYGMAETHPQEFWIYVIENARDLQRQRVNAIANPFSKVEEYWFDDRWRSVSEEWATAQDINITVGAQVSHGLWGTGTIVSVERRGIAWFLTVDFGSIEGRRHIPYNANLKFVD